MRLGSLNVPPWVVQDSNETLALAMSQEVRLLLPTCIPAGRADQHSGQNAADNTPLAGAYTCLQMWSGRRSLRGTFMPFRGLQCSSELSLSLALQMGIISSRPMQTIRAGAELSGSSKGLLVVGDSGIC